MQLTLRNDEHGTEYTLRVTSLPHVLSPGQAAAAKRELCGTKRICSCGIICGPQNGPNGETIEVKETYTPDGRRTWIIPGRIFTCAKCGKESIGTRNSRMWCSDKCRMRFNRSHKCAEKAQ